MPTTPDNEAHNYAERIRARLPRRLQELREAAGMSKYALAKKAGVSRDMVGCIEGGESIPTLHVSARLAYGVDLTLTEFVAGPRPLLGVLRRRPRRLWQQLAGV